MTQNTIGCCLLLHGVNIMLYVTQNTIGCLPFMTSCQHNAICDTEHNWVSSFVTWCQHNAIWHRTQLGVRLLWHGVNIMLYVTQNTIGCRLLWHGVNIMLYDTEHNWVSAFYDMVSTQCYINMTQNTIGCPSFVTWCQHNAIWHRTQLGVRLLWHGVNIMLYDTEHNWASAFYDMVST